jgi:hypothetical protein
MKVEASYYFGRNMHGQRVIFLQTPTKWRESHSQEEDSNVQQGIPLGREAARVITLGGDARQGKSRNTT